MLAGLIDSVNEESVSLNLDQSIFAQEYLSRHDMDAGFPSSSLVFFVLDVNSWEEPTYIPIEQYIKKATWCGQKVPCPA